MPYHYNKSSSPPRCCYGRQGRRQWQQRALQLCPLARGSLLLEACQVSTEAGLHPRMHDEFHKLLPIRVPSGPEAVERRPAQGPLGQAPGHWVRLAVGRRHLEGLRAQLGGGHHLVHEPQPQGLRRRQQRPEHQRALRGALAHDVDKGVDEEGGHDDAEARLIETDGDPWAVPCHEAVVTGRSQQRAARRCMARHGSDSGNRGPIKSQPKVLQRGPELPWLFL
mmetsp:Transcript_4064/g.6931  ORF Transcript_4064/g.6931 Transcript_4064/m.6931 type:complete len:223 (+) Transcript_4064:228-896(+)